MATETDVGTTENNVRLEGDWTAGAVTYLTTSINLQMLPYVRTYVNVLDQNNNGSYSGSFGSGSLVNPAFEVNGVGRFALRRGAFSKTVTLTNAPQTQAFYISIVNFDYAVNDDLYAEFYYTVPARPAPPALTGVTVLRESDTSHKISWALGNATVAGDQQNVVQRSDDEGSTWTTVQTVGGSVTTWTDKGTVANGRYRWRVYSKHAAASSTPSTSTTYYTTPASPVVNTVTKNTDNSITVGWTDRSPYNSTFGVWESTTGPTGAYTLLTTVADGTGEYRHVAPNQSVTHTYKIDSRVGSLASALSAPSETVQLQAPPNAPTFLSPIGVALNAAQPHTLRWQHNPVDSTLQTAFEYSRRYSTDGVTWGAATASGKIASTTQQAIVSGWPTGYVEIKARTWGAHATASAYSDPKIYRLSQLPNGSISSPVENAVLQGNRLVVTWAYNDPEGSAQSGWQLILVNTATGETPGTWSAAGSATSFEIPLALENNGSYAVDLVVTDGAGLNSATDRANFTTLFQAPPAPTVEATWDEATGAIVLAISNPTEVDPQPVVISNIVRRDGLVIAEVARDSAITDPIPPTNRPVIYTVEAWSALPSSVSVEVVTVAPVEVSRNFWLNSGSGWTRVASFFGNVTRSRTHGLVRATRHYAHRPVKVQTIGQSIINQFSAKATHIQSWMPEEAFYAVALESTVVCYRSPYGRWFVSIDPIDVSSSETLTYQIGLNLEETDYTEGML